MKKQGCSVAHKEVGYILGEFLLGVIFLAPNFFLHIVASHLPKTFSDYFRIPSSTKNSYILYIYMNSDLRSPPSQVHLKKPTNISSSNMA